MNLRVLVGATLLVCVLGLVGNAATNVEIRVTITNNGETVSLARGDALLITLKSNPTTGYSWSVKEGGNPVLKQTGALEFSPSQHIEGMVGVGGAETLTLIAVEPGKTRVKLVYVRPWEKDTPPEGSFEINISVK